MRNKIERYNKRPGRYVELAEYDINNDTAMNKKWHNYKPITTFEDESKFKEGYNYGIKNLSIEDSSKLKNIFFQRGYLLGQRKYYVEEHKKIKQNIALLVSKNIPLEEYPEYIKNNEMFKSIYVIEKCKQLKLKK